LQRFILFILYAGFLILPATAQNPRLNKVLWSDNLKLEIKTGAITIMSPVPEKYLAFTNNLNVPIEVPGMLGVFSAKRSVTPHLEVGYQLDYLRVQGNARDVNQAPVEVRTQILTHCFQGQYNFKRNDVFKPLFNYFVYYKMGGISVKNDHISPDESLPLPEEEGKLNSNVAIMSGIGAGINYQLSDHLSLTGAVDINRSSDRVQEILYVHKLFYNSSYTVNKFAEISVGLTYWFSWSSQKKSSNYYRPMSETQQLILQSKIERKKGKSSKSYQSIWFDRKRGK
jgi:hypothetical protein